jgi:hypothetical protein
VDAALLRPGRRASQVVGERIPVVRRNGQSQHELVCERPRGDDEEQHREGATRNLGQLSARRCERQCRPAARPPQNDGGGEQHSLGSRKAASGHCLERRQHQRHDPEIRDQREICAK